jgi:hypothetical protein
VTRSARRGSVAALPLFASVASASAEYAWVLWEHFLFDAGTNSIDEWRLSSADRTPEACHGTAERGITWRASQKWLDLPEREPEKTVVEGNRVRRGSMSWQYLCLPDTVDPRRPK